MIPSRVPRTFPVFLPEELGQAASVLSEEGDGLFCQEC